MINSIKYRYVSTQKVRRDTTSSGTIECRIRETDEVFASAVANGSGYQIKFEDGTKENVSSTIDLIKAVEIRFNTTPGA